MNLEGNPSDALPRVLATGRTAVTCVFTSFSAREPEDRDADYIAWHSLDHRPEQYRLPGLRHSLRIVSTPECRAMRAASVETLDAVDHVMTYLFTDADSLPGFSELGAALDEGGRMALRLPSIGYMVSDLVGMAAAQEAVAGADVIPWRPTTGVYLLVEDGHASPDSLIDIPGIAGLWWSRGRVAPSPFNSDTRARQITYCFIDKDPIAVAGELRERLSARWASGEVRGLLAAPFFTVIPFAWSQYLP